MRGIVLIGVATLLTGCATQKNLYAWGGYEDLIYVSYSAPDKLSPEDQIEKLEQDSQKAQATGALMPPGWHAHLGSLYAQSGHPEEARRELLKEKAQFPESDIFVDHLLSNLNKP
jgi:hypothetical protein